MPTWRLGYWMWILRSARSMKTTKATTATTITMMPTITAGLMRAGAALGEELRQRARAARRRCR